MIAAEPEMQKSLAEALATLDDLEKDLLKGQGDAKEPCIQPKRA